MPEIEGLAELKEYTKEHPTRNVTGPPANRRNTLTDQHLKAILWKVEDGLNNQQIAERLNVSPQAVGQWWKMPHVIREIRRQKERFNSETRPAIIKESEEIRGQLMTRLRTRADGNEMKDKDIISGIKLTNDMIDRAVEQEIEDEDKATAKEADDKAWNALTPEEQDRLARRIGLGSKEPVFIDEAEVVDGEIIEDAPIGSGDSQETGAS